MKNTSGCTKHYLLSTCRCSFHSPRPCAVDKTHENEHLSEVNKVADQKNGTAARALTFVRRKYNGWNGGKRQLEWKRSGISQWEGGERGGKEGVCATGRLLDAGAEVDVAGPAGVWCGFRFGALTAEKKSNEQVKNRRGVLTSVFIRVLLSSSFFFFSSSCLFW